MGSDGQIYVFGGCERTYWASCVGPTTYSNTAEVYNPSSATNPWRVIPMPAACWKCGAAEAIDGRMYVNNVGAYSPSTLTWKSFSPSPDGPQLVSPGGSCHGYLYGIGISGGMDRAAVRPTC